MIRQPTVRMIQMTDQLWRIESVVGAILQKNIVASSKAEALEYVKNYCSSYDGWTYEVIVL